MYRQICVQPSTIGMVPLRVKHCDFCHPIVILDSCFGFCRAILNLLVYYPQLCKVSREEICLSSCR